MKITRLEINNFRQFENFKLDLTYPAGHPKEGQPLEKVCFIGQSGTGKTTILKLLFMWIFDQPGVMPSWQGMFHRADSPIVEAEFDGKLIRKREDLNWVPGNPNFFKIDQNIESYFFPAEPDGSLRILLDGTEVKRREAGNKKYFIFEKSWADLIWKEVFSTIRQYKEKEAEFRLELTHKLEKEEIDPRKELELWRKKTLNPLKDIADNCLDQILNQFNLQTKTKIEKLGDVKTLQVETLSIETEQESQTINYDDLSTGIRQIITTVIPLFVGKPSEGFIFMDEPETSLFPDIQRILIPYYTSFSESSQWFFATHSPIIAAQFDPAERIILDFDEKGKVTWKRGQAPEGDDPNDLLTQDFGMRNLLGPKGIEALKRYVELLGLIKFEKDEAQKAAYIKEYLKIGREYGFGDEKNPEDI